MSEWRNNEQREDVMCLSGGTCLPEQREQRLGMRIMCLSGGTCL